MIDKISSFILFFLFGIFLYNPNLKEIEASAAIKEESEFVEINDGSEPLTPLVPARKRDLPAIIDYIVKEFLNNENENILIQKVDIMSNLNDVFKIEIFFFKSKLNELINSLYYYYGSENLKIYFNKDKNPSRTDTLVIDSSHLKEIVKGVLKKISLDNINAILKISSKNISTGQMNLRAEYENPGGAKPSENPQEDLESFFGFKEKYPFFPESQEGSDNYLYKISRIYSLGLEPNAEAPQDIPGESYKKILNNMMNFIEVSVQKKLISAPEKSEEEVVEGIELKIFLKQDVFDINRYQMKID